MNKKKKNLIGALNGEGGRSQDESHIMIKTSIYKIKKKN